MGMYRMLPKFVGYRFGSNGSVWSRLRRGGSGGLDKKWRRLRGLINKNGYVLYDLKVGNRYVRRFGHCLILEAFRGPRPAGMIGRHLNKKRTDNRIRNLVWAKRYTDHPKRPPRRKGCPHLIGLLEGSKNPCAKLTEEDIPMILSLFKTGLPLIAIARQYGVSGTAISRIHKKLTWTHVPRE